MTQWKQMVADLPPYNDMSLSEIARLLLDKKGLHTGWAAFLGRVVACGYLELVSGNER